MPARKGNVGDPGTRDALLDAAQRIMVAEGYPAATIRRVADDAGVNSALVSYYFGSRDGLFVELFRRGAERSFDRLQQVLSSSQPLWGLWELLHDRSGSASTMEFIALANHRKAIRDEIAEYSRRFRGAQIDALAEVLAGYGIDPDEWPASVVVLGLSSLSRFMLIEEAFEVDVGHAEAVARIESFIERCEGPRSGSTR